MNVIKITYRNDRESISTVIGEQFFSTATHVGLYDVHHNTVELNVCDISTIDHLDAKQTADFHYDRAIKDASHYIKNTLAAIRMTIENPPNPTIIIDDIVKQLKTDNHI